MDTEGVSGSLYDFDRLQKKHNLTECATKEAQSNRMSLIGEGIECLVTKTLHTPT